MKSDSRRDDSGSDTELLVGGNPAAGDDQNQTILSANDEEFSDDESDVAGSHLRRREALDHIARIEREFTQLKDRLYQEKMAGLQREMDQVLAATHAELREQLNHMEKTKTEKLNVIELWRRFLLDTVENGYKTEKEAAVTEFQSEKEGISQRLLASLQEKKKRLEEERANMDISLELISDYPRNQPTRKLRKRGEQEPSRPSKKMKTSGPAIVHALTEPEIVEDLFIIKKSGPGPGTSSRRTVRTNPRN